MIRKVEKNLAYKHYHKSRYYVYYVIFQKSFRNTYRKNDSISKEVTGRWLYIEIDFTYDEDNTEITIFDGSYFNDLSNAELL